MSVKGFTPEDTRALRQIVRNAQRRTKAFNSWNVETALTMLHDAHNGAWQAGMSLCREIDEYLKENPTTPYKTSLQQLRQQIYAGFVETHKTRSVADLAFNKAVKLFGEILKKKISVV